MRFALAPVLARAFDRTFTAKRVEAFERTAIALAVGGFVVHLGLVFLANALTNPPRLVRLVGDNYLSTLYTPFSFILFYEVLLLVLATARSTTRSLGRQYEIVSLIVIRNVFKDIADFDGFRVLRDQLGDFADVLVDMGGGLAMFLLVAVFYHVRRKLDSAPAVSEDFTSELRTFIMRKKATALLLAILLFALAAYNLSRWGIEVFRVAYAGASPTIDVRLIFYVDLFTVMIFSDVLVLLFSMLRSDAYRLVFRNAGFIISTILIRFSLTIDKPYDVALGLLAMIFGILVQLLYHYSRRIEAPKEVRVVADA